MTEQETKPTTSSSTDESSSSGGSGGGARKHIPLAIRAPPPPPPRLSSPAVTAMTVSVALTAAAAAQPLPQDFSPRSMAHDLMAEIVATTGYVWDIDALVLLQVAAEDFLNGFTEVELGEMAEDFEKFVRGLGQQY